MKALFLAPGNSIHSHKWIGSISSLDSSDTFYWFSYEPFIRTPINCIRAYSPPAVLSFSPIRFIFFVLHLILNLASTKYDIIHIHSAGTYSIFACLCSLFGIPYIITPWGSDIIFGSKNSFKRLFLIAALRKARLVTCDAHFVKELVLRLSPESQVQIINFGIDTDFFKRSSDVPSENVLRAGSINIISNRNHEPVYNIETLIKAAKLLSNENIPFNLEIAGTGSLTPSLIALVERLQIQSLVTFSGRYDYNNLPNMLCRNDIYVSTSLSDAGISASIAEAMSCELICIASDSAENPLWINSAENGFLFSAGSAESLFQCILKSLELRNDWLNIGKFARDTICSRNDISVEMRKAYQLMQSCSVTYRKVHTP